MRKLDRYHANFRTVITSNMISEVSNDCHNDRETSYLGFQKTCNLLDARFWHLNLQQEIKRMSSECNKCCVELSTSLNRRGFLVAQRTNYRSPYKVPCYQPATNVFELQWIPSRYVFAEPSTDHQTKHFQRKYPPWVATTPRFCRLFEPRMAISRGSKVLQTRDRVIPTPYKKLGENWKLRMGNRLSRESAGEADYTSLASFLV